MFRIARRWRGQRSTLRPLLQTYRSIGSSLLDPEVFAVAQKLAVEAAADSARKLTHLKVQMPATDEHTQQLAALNERSKGLWDAFSCE